MILHQGRFAPIVLCFACFVALCACGTAKRESNPPAPAEYQFQLEQFYPNTATVYQVPPDYNCGEFLVCAVPPVSANSPSDNVFLVKEETRQEKTLAISAAEVQGDAQAYYYIALNKIFAVDKATMEERLLYQAEEGAKCLPRLSYGGGRLVWTELESPQPGENQWNLYALDCETAEVRLLASTNYMYSPYDRFKVRNQRLAYMELLDNQLFRIKGIHTANGEVEVSIDTALEPVGLAYDGNFLVWSDDEGMHCYCLDTEETIHKEWNVSDVDICGSLIIYAELFQIYVYDLSTGKTLFATSTEEEPRMEYLNWFNFDEASKTCTLSGWDNEGPGDRFFIASLSIQQK